MFIGRTDAEAETPILWPPHERVHSFEKTLMLGKIEGRRRRGDRGWDGWMASLTRWTWVWVDSELVMDREAWHAAVHEVVKSRTWLSNWTELNIITLLCTSMAVVVIWTVKMLCLENADLHHPLSSILTIFQTIFKNSWIISVKYHLYSHSFITSSCSNFYVIMLLFGRNQCNTVKQLSFN